METKFCKKCNDYLPISEFHNSQNSLLCKFHHNEIGRENKEKYRKDIPRQRRDQRHKLYNFYKDEIAN